MKGYRTPSWFSTKGVLGIKKKAISPKISYETRRESGKHDLFYSRMNNDR